MRNKGIDLGRTYWDEITSFTGVATVESEFLNGCRRIVLEPGLNKDGEKVPGQVFDIQQLVLQEDVPRIECEIGIPTLPMKAEVRDIVTRIEGVVVGRTSILGGPAEITIQPKTLKKDGTPADTHIVYETRVELLKQVKETPAETPAKKTPGGPQSWGPKLPGDHTR